MLKQIGTITALTVVMLGMNAATSPSASHLQAAVGSPCDRSCLIGMVDRYLAAMVKHDPAGLPLGGSVKYTENPATIQLGDGLWVGASEGPTTFKIYAADPTAGQVGFFGILKEFGRPAILALRLKVEKGKITEIEHVVPVTSGAQEWKIS